MPITVREFANFDPSCGEPIFPETKITRGIASAGSLQLQSGTVYVVITSDALHFLTLDGATPTTQDIPCPQSGLLRFRVLQLTSLTLKVL